jgi:cation transport protein ChaC
MKKHLTGAVVTRNAIRLGDMGDFWVFGYGSLIWRPGFAHIETRRARLYGYRRSLCVYSLVHRGTRERPGLVLGLDRGGSCIGLAYRVPGNLRDEVLSYLRDRELVTSVYLERMLDVRLDGGASGEGGTVEAVAYIVDRQHEQYAGALDPDEAAKVVRGAVGQSGNNEDYVLSTLEHLEALGIRDHWLEEVGRQVAPS